MNEDTAADKARPEDNPTTPPEDPEAGQPDDSGFEASVKGIGQGIAGKLKEMFGELIDDPDLEQAGIVQQLEGRIRRAEAEEQPSPRRDPTPES